MPLNKQKQKNVLVLVSISWNFEGYVWNTWPPAFILKTPLGRGVHPSASEILPLLDSGGGCEQTDSSALDLEPCLWTLVRSHVKQVAHLSQGWSPAVLLRSAPGSIGHRADSGLWSEYPTSSTPQCSCGCRLRPAGCSHFSIWNSSNLYPNPIE